MDKRGYVYILTNPLHTVLYTGVTSDLRKRVWEHKEKLADGFTKKYNASKLVYYELADDILTAIAREKQIKARPRSYKVELIERLNHDWHDLSDEL